MYSSECESCWHYDYDEEYEEYYCMMDLDEDEVYRIMTIAHRRDYQPVRVTASMQDLVERASHQNFVPVVDDYGTFIGLITRKSIIKYCHDKLFSEE